MITNIVLFLFQIRLPDTLLSCALFQQGKDNAFLAWVKYLCHFVIATRLEFDRFYGIRTTFIVAILKGSLSTNYYF